MVSIRKAKLQSVFGFLSIVLIQFILIENLCAQNKKPKFTEIKISGYFRNYMTFRNMQQNYITGGPFTPKTIMVNGIYKDAPGNGMITGYREPLMLINMAGKPSANTSFEVDFLFDNQMTGQILNDNFDIRVNPHPINGDPNSGAMTMPRRIQSARWLNLGGTASTKFGHFDMKAGGVLFVNMTSSTLWNYEYRDDMFERFPWEWQTVSFKRYTGYYNDKNIARDSRWGNAALQGVSLKATQLPLRFGFMFAYGKTNSTGGFQSFLNNNNQDMTAFQLNKKMSTHTLSGNFYQSRVLINPSSYERNHTNIAQEQILTGELKLNFKGLSLNSELGAGSLSNPIDSIRRWTPLVNIKATIGEGISPIPINAHFYHIGADVVNLNSAILNSSNRNVQPQFGLEPLYNNTIFEGAVTEFGQLTNNRQGINLSTGVDVKESLKFMLALSSQQELENKFNIITYQHRLNGFTRSQFDYYRNGTGPYGRQMNAWRRSWEKLTISDTTIDYKKGFNLIDFSAKAQTNLFGRPIIFSNFINYNSVQDNIAPLALFSSKAFLRNLYEEFMIFYSIHNKWTIISVVGMERSIGNNRTDLALNGKPVDQTGYGYGFGFDIDLSSSAGLYIRQKWYSFTDKNFVDDRFKGYDTNVELKIFF